MKKSALFLVLLGTALLLSGCGCYWPGHGHGGGHGNHHGCGHRQR